MKKLALVALTLCALLPGAARGQDKAADAAAQQRDIADYGSSVNFWQWGTKRDKYQEIWNQVKAGQ